VERSSGGIVRTASLVGGTFLLFLHFFPALFDLPAAAANLSPFDVSVFGVQAVKLRSVRDLAADPEWVRLGGSIALAVAIWGLVRTVPGLSSILERGWSTLRRVPERRFLLGVALAQLTLLATISIAVFDRMPHVQDEIGQYFQGRIFASGKLYAQPPAQPELFSFYSVIQTDKWYSQHPPGFPLLLAPLLLAGIPWLLNPILGAGCTVLTFQLGKTLWGEGAGRGAALLLLVSPFHAFMGASFMNHTATLFFLLLFAVLLVGALGTGRGAAAGVSLGIAILTRPLVSLGIGVLFGAVAVFRADAGRRARLAAGVVAGLALPVGFFLWYNALTNGGPLTLGYTVADPELHRLGFASAPVPYSPLRALIKTGQLVRGLDLYLFAWPLPSLFLVWILFLRGTAGRREMLLLAAALLVPFAYFGYWFQDMCLGPRFAYESIPFWALLSERAFVTSRAGLPSSPGRRPFLASLVVASVLWGLLFQWPILARGYSASYWGVNRELTRVVERVRLGEAVVLVEEESCPWYYGAGFWANSPDLSGDVIYARDLGPDATERLSTSFPGRALYRYDCGSGTLGSPDPR